MANVEWIKLTTDIRDNRKIKRIRKLPDGDTMFLVWILLLTLAGECNDMGRLSFTDDIPYDAELIADELHIDVKIVEKALNEFLLYSMIYKESGFYIIEGWEEYQNTEGMERIREQNRIRKQRQRDREKGVTDMSHVTSRDSHATDKNRIDKDKIRVEREEKKSFLDILEDV